MTSSVLGKLGRVDGLYQDLCPVKVNVCLLMRDSEMTCSVDSCKYFQDLSVKI